jgi:NTP pyrophosphatase (non-canonical NTP hydrolase)
MNIEKIQKILSEFAKEREWEQFHTPKNLTMALSVESSELVEIFQWLTPEQSSNLTDKQKVLVKEEIADIAIYLLRLCDVLDVDIEASVIDKIKINSDKYPVDLSKGNADKYTTLRSKIKGILEL